MDQQHTNRKIEATQHAGDSHVSHVSAEGAHLLTSKGAGKELAKHHAGAHTGDAHVPKLTISGDAHQHAVKNGENLWKISESELKTQKQAHSPKAIQGMVDKIVEANKAQYPSLEKNPHQIDRSMSLVIPPLSDGKPHSAAEKQAKEAPKPEIKTAGKPADTDKSNATRGLVKPEGEKPVAAVKPEGEKPVATVKPEGEKPVATVKPEGEKPVAAVKPEGEKPVAAVKPEGEKPVAAVKPEGEKPVAVVKPEGEKPVAAVKPEGEKPVVAVKPEGEKPVAAVKPAGEKAVAAVKPEGEKPAAAKHESEKPVHHHTSKHAHAHSRHQPAGDHKSSAPHGTKGTDTDSEKTTPKQSNPVPDSQAKGPVNHVVASWYHEGTKTANGEHYNPDGLTVASKSLPFGTRLEVTNPANGNHVIVRVNDRGPFVKGRSLDLSRGAARQLGMINQGVAQVDYKIL